MKNYLSEHETVNGPDPNDKVAGVSITTNRSMRSIDAGQWNRMVDPDNPGLRHEMLLAFEESGCCCPESGWTPCHLTAHRDGNLIGGAPCYLKTHSYGEFVFDWAWANAYQRHGLSYYPKLLVAVPFTPVGGQRLLHHLDYDEELIRKSIAKALPAVATELKASSVHCIFCTESDLRLLCENRFVRREGRQFHWHNNQYQDFSDFLTRLSSKKRKNILRERRRVVEQDIALQWHHGKDITKEYLDLLYLCYRNTIAEHGSYAYLNRKFFEILIETIPDGVQLLTAHHGGQPIACAFFLRGKDSLYGRYWGALAHASDLHFEACYYAPIEYCIENGLKRFEAGAQGEHKLSRGLTPQTTLSAHWLAHEGFHDAVRRFTAEEESHLADYTDILDAHSPFKQNGDEDTQC